MNTENAEDKIQVEVVIQAFPSGDFKISPLLNATQIDTSHANRIRIFGNVAEVNQTMATLRYRPGCITNPSNALELNITFCLPASRLLQAASNSTTTTTTPT